MAREYSPEVKAQVMAALMGGQSASSVAKEFGIPRGTVAAWWTRKTQPVVASAATAATDAAQKKQERITELVLDLLIAQLESQIAMAQHAGDKQWLSDQDASAIAMLYGVGNDKVFRLLEALEGARSASKPTGN